ncbi:RteC domain-containing protein [Pedobacter sp. LMG 31643]|nr:RteC domain-containing protein [Pedobacter foliorum]
MIYLAEMYTMETGIPFGDREKQVTFLTEELAYLERYFKKYALHYQYFILGADDLDHLFFLRGKLSTSIIIPNGRIWIRVFLLLWIICLRSL